MNCKKCGAPLAENDIFCKNCGAAVNEMNAQNNIGGVQSTSNQNEFNNVQQPINNGLGVEQLNNYQQPMNNYNNSYNYQPLYNQPPKNNNTKFILLGICIAVVLVVGIILIYVFVGKDNSEISGDGSNNTGTTTGENNNSGTTTDDNKNDDSSSVNNTSNYTVKFKGFTFKIPTNLVYETEIDSILLGDEDGTWATYIEVIEGSYNQILSNKNQLQTIYQQQGYSANPAVEKNIGGVNFLTLEISKSGYNALLGFSKANSMYLFGTTTYNLDNEYDYEVLKTISSILSSAEFNSEANNMSTFEKVDMSGISGLA